MGEYQYLAHTHMCTIGGGICWHLSFGTMHGSHVYKWSPLCAVAGQVGGALLDCINRRCGCGGDTADLQAKQRRVALSISCTVQFAMAFVATPLIVVATQCEGKVAFMAMCGAGMFFLFATQSAVNISLLMAVPTQLRPLAMSINVINAVLKAIKHSGTV